MCKDCEGCEHSKNERCYAAKSYSLENNFERCPWPSKRVEKKKDMSELLMVALYREGHDIKLAHIIRALREAGYEK
jgi:hypothetical protein